MTAVIGIIGAEVPRQLVLAAGAAPRPLPGSWDGGLDDRAAALLGTVDPVVTGILTELLAGRHSDLAGLIVCNDTQSHLRLFYVLRMPARRGPSSRAPARPAAGGQCRKRAPTRCSSSKR
ncbi:hypothetical protein [Microbacterium elymi]|uniref:Uncharacterized protein n=1 Tax=Microbacterium elymi TaxID=2909587 RepID=A0ABY5NHQ4_9MICO|nr:hypothetical protein [Microbacterium elymi]UUT34707.1 hypothetical protein L2X98_30005 [Microbacterium elymi]